MKKEISCTTEKLKFSVHVPNLFQEIIDCNKEMDIMRIPLNVLQQILVGVSKRAVELDDDILHSYMCRMALYEQADPEQPWYDAEVSNKYKQLTYNN